MKSRKLIFSAPRQAEWQEWETGPLAEDEVLVETEYSAVSAGTELANYVNAPNTPGGYPRSPGYSACGRIVEMGSAVPGMQLHRWHHHSDPFRNEPLWTTLAVGDRVATHWRPHGWHQKMPASEVVKVPEDVDPAEAAFSHIATFPMLAVRRLEIRLGEAAMVQGLGVLGMLAVQFARLAGACPVIAVDFDEERRRKALALGADLALAPDDPEFRAKLDAATDGRGPQAVVEVTGKCAALVQALENCAWNGRIALLGCTRVSDAPVDWYRHVHRRGVRLIGAHTMTRPVLESSPEAWTELEDMRVFLNFLASGRVKVRPFLSGVISGEELPSLYARLASEAHPPVGFAVQWKQNG